MASAAGVDPVDPKEVLSQLEEQIVTITKKIEYNKLKIQEEETTIKNILKECLLVPRDPKKGIDPKKREGKMPEIKTHMEAKARLETLNQQETGKISNLQELVRRMQAADKGGKRRKTTTRKQKGRRTTKKQNKNKKSRKQ